VEHRKEEAAYPQPVKSIKSLNRVKAEKNEGKARVD